ncbi:hypothetical protein LAZ67_6003536 [Cordylochernes scorpioides]|uniref:Uncharacterized protein n=1 Tax=Cordylochernes scorpioides TaxID=51811 RepID=A0ABY6KNM2_9ARAC|nr:hypothetical protein LAZ67_6003536 [Cordylochernes scorpioides]
MRDLSIPDSHFREGILIFEKRLNKCIEVKGDYRRILEVRFIVHRLFLDSVGDFVEAPEVASTILPRQDHGIWACEGAGLSPGSNVEVMDALACEGARQISGMILSPSYHSDPLFNWFMPRGFARGGVHRDIVLCRYSLTSTFRRILEVRFIVHRLFLDSVGDFVEAPEVASTEPVHQGEVH